MDMRTAPSDNCSATEVNFSNASNSPSLTSQTQSLIDPSSSNIQIPPLDDSNLGDSSLPDAVSSAPSQTEISSDGTTSSEQTCAIQVSKEARARYDEFLTRAFTPEDGYSFGVTRPISWKSSTPADFELTDRLDILLQDKGCYETKEGIDHR